MFARLWQLRAAPLPPSKIFQSDMWSPSHVLPASYLLWMQEAWEDVRILAWLWQLQASH